MNYPYLGRIDMGNFVTFIEENSNDSRGARSHVEGVFEI